MRGYNLDERGACPTGIGLPSGIIQKHHHTADTGTMHHYRMDRYSAPAQLVPDGDYCIYCTIYH
jgi:hypothetical protein